jgi:hypothetical protein
MAGEDRHGTRGRMFAGAVAGVVGGLVFWAVMLAVHSGAERWAAVKLAAYPILADRALRPGADLPAVVLGAVGHFALSVGWGVLFALLVQRASRVATVGLGVLWGLVAWAVMFGAVLPRMARPLAEGGGSQGTVLIHLLFGLGLGLGLWPFQTANDWEQGRATPLHGAG